MPDVVHRLQAIEAAFQSHRESLLKGAQRDASLLAESRRIIDESRALLKETDKLLGRDGAERAKGYHCYVLGKSGRISSRHDFMTSCDAKALIQARFICELSEAFPCIEVWNGSRVVGRLALADGHGEAPGQRAQPDMPLAVESSARGSRHGVT